MPLRLTDTRHSNVVFSFVTQNQTWCCTTSDKSSWNVFCWAWPQTAQRCIPCSLSLPLHCVPSLFQFCGSLWAPFWIFSFFNSVCSSCMRVSWYLKLSLTFAILFLICSPILVETNTFRATNLAGIGDDYMLWINS